MASSSRRARAAAAAPRAAAFAGVLLVAILAAEPRAAAQEQALGFAVDRLYPSAPGGGWFVMDALDMRGGLGGAAALSVGYANHPLRITSSDGARAVPVVSKQATADFAFAVTCERWRFYLGMTMPLFADGRGASIDGRLFSAPRIDLGTHPDTLSDPRLGVDVRLVGAATSAFRAGAGAQIIAPSGARSEYVTDGSYRAMGRLLFAGDVGLLAYAGHLGVHVRPLDDSRTPESPRGSEALFGAAAGARMLVGPTGAAALVVGPEIYGASALRSLFGPTTTAVEALLSARIEGTADRGPQLRLKLGTGPGISQHFGAPEWRTVFAIELFDHRDGRAAK